MVKLLPLLILFLSAATTVSGGGRSSPQRRGLSEERVTPAQVQNIIEALIGAGDFSSWANVLFGLDPATLPISSTLFIPADDVLARVDPPADYEADCLKLIAQFKTLTSSLPDSVDRFVDAYNLDCPAALNRLLTSGVPATVEHRAASSSAAPSSAAVVAECVQHFITAMDSLKLNMVAVDQVHPLLADLSSSLAKLSLLPPDFEGKVKMKDWLARLSKMSAADELTEQQARQLHFDLESSYNSFMAALPSAGA